MKADLYVPTGVRVIRGNNLSGGREPEGDYVHVTEKTADALASSCLKAGDLVFPHRGNIGQVGITPDDGRRYMLSTSLMKLSPDRQKADPLYLMYFFKSAVGRAALLANTSQVGTPGIATPLKSLRSIRLPLPPMSAQQEIAAILAALDDRITLLRETNATLEAIAQALFKSWFVDFDPVRAKMEGRVPEGMDEAAAALFPNAMEQSKSDLTPQGWSKLRVEALAERIGMGPFGSNIKVSTFVDEGVPVLNGANVQGALLEHGNFRYVTKEHAGRLRNSCVHQGDIVLTHRGTLGQVALVPSHSRFNEYVLSQSQFFLRCDVRFMQPEWMLYCLRSPSGQHLLLANASQVGVPSIARPTSYLKSIELVVPPVELVRRFAEVARSFHSAIVANRATVDTLAALRDTLLPRLIAGQLRLPVLPDSCVD